MDLVLGKMSCRAFGSHAPGEALALGGRRVGYHPTQVFLLSREVPTNPGLLLQKYSEVLRSVTPLL